MADLVEGTVAAPAAAAAATPAAVATPATTIPAAASAASTMLGAASAPLSSISQFTSMGGSMGGGSMASGSTVMEKNLDRVTVVAAVLFTITTILLGLLMTTA